MNFGLNLLAALAGLLVGAISTSYGARRSQSRSADDADRTIQEQAVALASMQVRLEDLMKVSEQMAAVEEAPIQKNSAPIDPEILAVITAAATVALETPVVVRSAQLVQGSNSAWSRQGRTTVQSSHVLQVKR